MHSGPARPARRRTTEEHVAETYDAVIIGGGHNGLVRPPTWPAPG